MIPQGSELDPSAVDPRHLDGRLRASRDDFLWMADMRQVEIEGMSGSSYFDSQRKAGEVSVARYDAFADRATGIAMDFGAWLQVEGCPRWPQ